MQEVQAEAGRGDYFRLRPASWHPDPILGCCRGRHRPVSSPGAQEPSRAGRGQRTALPRMEHSLGMVWRAGGQEGRGRRPEYNPHWPTLDQTGPVSTAHPSPEARPASNRHLNQRPRPIGPALSSCSEPPGSLAPELKACSLGWTSNLPHPLVERGKPCTAQPGPAPLLPRQAALPAPGTEGPAGTVERRGGPWGTSAPPSSAL